HRRLVGRAAVPVGAIGAVEGRQVHLLHGAQDRPCQVVLGQPFPEARRHQQHLLAVTLDEVLRHAASFLNPPDGTLFPTATAIPRALLRALRRHLHAALRGAAAERAHEGSWRYPPAVLRGPAAPAARQRHPARWAWRWLADDARASSAPAAAQTGLAA